MGLKDIFSEDNLIAYAGACLDLATELPKKRRFDTLLIPSRGAVPMFLGMLHALPKFNWNQVHKDFYNELGVESLVTNLIPKGEGLAGRLDDKKIKVLMLPFTADLNFLGKSEGETLNYTKKIRRYWARVAASFMKNPSARKCDPFFNTFTDAILREIEGRGQLAESYERFPQVRQFAMIDTVVSGRASFDILTAFDTIVQRHLDGAECINGVCPDDILPYAHLVVDEEGRKLNKRFSPYLNRKKATGQIKMYPIPRIVSEDKGANLEGVAAVVYPSIMEASEKLFRGHQEFFIGAGSWHTEIPKLYLENFQKFMHLVYSAIDARYAIDLSDTCEQELEVFRALREDFIDYAKRNKLLDRHNEDPEKLNIKKRNEIARHYETSSHVVHIYFTPGRTSEIINGVLHNNSGLYPPIVYKETAHSH